MGIKIQQINKVFGSITVLNNIDLSISSGQMVALLGPSGSGKTTLLRIIAGLEHQNSGSIYFNGKDISGLHARDRQVGFVFQHYALFRHMTVFDNIAFGLKILPRCKRPSKTKIKELVMNLIEMVHLSHLSQRFPSQLSGGQKQRVALARALAIEPQILLLDEPFGALDEQVRKELRRWLRKLHEELKFTSVFVTHDQEEAMEVANIVVVMRQGNIEQVGIPDEVWRKPATRFVLEFLGDINRFDAKMYGSKFYVAAYHWSLGYIPSYQGDIELLLRPWEIDISRQSNLDTPLPVHVIEIRPRGHFWQLMVQPIDWNGQPFSVIYDDENIQPIYGERLFIGLQQARLYHGSIQLRSDKALSWKHTVTL
ncbi:sulfate/thiosulfate ABC transporter ATP-binding protein CysA [Pantoea sp. Aalb]|uniref:sulfate/thiosulfate ABC transporter ATP-binding protein CysA n=1 Tax=Pantoea sp. Aalb TaxID=2576762 RepID=UPI0013256309|nr:sulfate/thiosulfate ABC transporter ATP-binding protein CysA [Pantoea sp. Aalb]MXP67282.1 sulfate/thiosulfate ABC transporter ATP-binding protein CysA [Pantoea sp. Aalb]